MRLLIVEDDAALADGLRYHLEMDGYQADVCADGAEGWRCLRQGAYDALLLDRMLPGIDGVALLRRARAAGLRMPVLMITALDGIGQRVEGLDAGADDYLVKPFAVEEMLARVRALLRRPAAWESIQTAEAFGLRLDEEKNLLRSETAACPLSKRETGLLSVFMRNAGQTMPRGLLLSKVWGPDAPVEEGNLDNYIYFLRKRLRAVGADARISTVRGVGYRLEA